MEIDPATRRSLELSRTLTGERRGSLLHAVDRTLTAAGGRLLGERLAAPLFDVDAIDLRLDLVSWFIAGTACCEEVRAQLRVHPDSEARSIQIITGPWGPSRSGSHCKWPKRSQSDCWSYQRCDK